MISSIISFCYLVLSYWNSLCDCSFSYVCHSYEYFLLFFAHNYSHVVWQIRDGLQYNPYFPGGAIAIPKMLDDGACHWARGWDTGSRSSGWSLFFLFLPYLLSVFLGSVLHPTICVTKNDTYFEFLCSVSLQMGKDAVTFLSWAAEPEMQEGKPVTAPSLFAKMLLHLIPCFFMFQTMLHIVHSLVCDHNHKSLRICSLHQKYHWVLERLN